MPRIVKAEFDVDGASNGVKEIRCGSDTVLTGRCRIYLGWDRGEQRIGKRVNVTQKLVRAGLYWRLVGPKIFIRDHAAASAADPGIPDFDYPSPYEAVGALFGWKVTLFETLYTYRCDKNCQLTVTSSRGGTYTNGSSDTYTGHFTMRSAPDRYDRSVDAAVTVQCVEHKGEIGYHEPGYPIDEIGAPHAQLAALVARRIDESERRQEYLLAQAMRDIALLVDKDAIELDKDALKRLLGKSEKPDKKA